MDIFEGDGMRPAETGAEKVEHTATALDLELETKNKRYTEDEEA